jgi:hypothetical protein
MSIEDGMLKATIDQLRAECSHLRVERDAARENEKETLLRMEWTPEMWAKLPDPGLEAEVARLRAAIEAAPHSPDCQSRFWDTRETVDCNCWKAEAR